jgi:alkylation response protein AidB-like acyl-CoA dehydrogenase
MISPELEELRASVRRFVDRELLPREGELPESDHLPPDLYGELADRLRAAGLWAFSTPVELGGGGGGVLAQTIVTEELSRSLYGLALAGRTGNPLPVLLVASPELVDRYARPVVDGERLGAFALTEPTGGADPVGNLRTTAVRDGDHWVLDGRKTFVSLGDIADHVVVFASTDRTLGARGITAFVVDADTPGFEVVRRIPTMGSLAPAELELSGCRVPDARRIGEVGHGFVLAQQALGRARAEIGARAVGASVRLLDEALSHVAARESFGVPLGAHQGVQWMLADCALDIEATRWLTYAAAQAADSGVDTRVADSLVKVQASEALGRVADRVLQLFGGWGYTKDLPIERFYREARMWRIVEGPNEVHRWAVARALGRRGTRALELRS